jgi:hypothetical protein
MGCNWSKRVNSKGSQYNSYNESESDYVSEEIDRIFVATSKSAVLCVDAATSPFWSRRSAGVNVSVGEIPDWEGTGESFGKDETSKAEISEIIVPEAEIPESSLDSPTIQHINSSPVVTVQSIAEMPLFKSLTQEKSRLFNKVLECNLCSKQAKGYCINCTLKRYCKECYDKNHDGLKHVFMNYKVNGKIDISSIRETRKQSLE